MNGMKFIKCSAVVATAAAVFGLSSARAMTVSWAAATDQGISTTGNLNGLPAGDLVEIGDFGGAANSTIAALSNSPTAVQAAFTEYATGFIGDGESGAPGTFTEAGSGRTGLGFFSQQIYMVAFNAATAGAATAVGVFEGPPGAAASGNSDGDPWTFPANDIGSIGIDAGDVSAAGVIIGQYVVNGIDSASLNESPANSLDLIVTVPEPSSIALVVMGLLGGIGLIRRRRS